jgi:serine/threonine protein kinase/Tol biopolymer transport system component
VIGTRLGAYEITGALGAGGMGEVFRATDTRLGRQVALKLLPGMFAADPERLARFEREARLLASLNHPNIAHLYGFETTSQGGGPEVHLLAMELAEGEDLAQRLKRGPVPIDEAIAIARQIAEALEEAHEKAIVHRDLKPANVMLAPDGKVKVLDFGLAKAWAGESTAGSTPDLSASPTLARQGTQAGLILGTAAYMAPEQARGKPVDKRADIWSFGVVLYEMLAGRRLFAGETVSDILAAVLKTEPDWSALPPDTPPRVRALLARCLERDPRQRLRDIGDARLSLDPRTTAWREESRPTAPSRPSRVARALPWTLVALLLGGLVWTTVRGGPSPAPGAAARSRVLALNLPPGLSIALYDVGSVNTQGGVLAVAPDGSRVAFAAGGLSTLYVRELDSAEPRALDGTAGATSPFFSPDGRWLGYFSPGKLRKVAIEGGRPIDLAMANLDRGAVWCPDGSIVYSPDATTGLWRLGPGDAPPRALTEIDVKGGERTHRWPALLPGGREVAFTVGRIDQPGHYEDARIDAVDLESGRRRPLFRGASMVRFTPGGIALLGREGQVLALPLEGSHGGRTDDARPVVRDVAGVAESGIVHFAVAADGTLVYAPRDPRASAFELAWLNPSGVAEPIAVPPGQYRLLRLSPDGRRVAMAVGPGSSRNSDIWVLDLGSLALTKLTFDGRSWEPAWSRDGKTVTYAFGETTGGDSLLRRPVDGSEDAVKVAPAHQGRRRAPVAWMPDGSLLFMEEAGADGGSNVLYVPKGGGPALPFAASAAVESNPAASPDGRWVAYTLFEGGRSSVYVQPFPPTGAKWLVAENAGVPAWSANGRELYFTVAGVMNAVTIPASGPFAAGPPRKLFAIPDVAVLNSDTSTSYVVAADGRFLVPRRTSTEPLGRHLVVHTNWFEALERILSSTGGSTPSTARP